MNAVPPLIHFLLVYDLVRQELILQEPFTDAAEAAARYAEAEQEHRQDSVEIVLVGADSMDTVRRTHSNYFERGHTLDDLLAGV
jgi:hypothetical protein